MTEHQDRMLGEAKTVVLATDGSVFNEGAVHEAILFCQTCKARLILLHVIGIDTELATYAHATAAEERNEAKEYMKKLEQEAADNDVECTTIIEESYQPDKSIVELARQHGADVIVMGRHGKKGLTQLLVGNMTSKIIGHGFPRVLVVPHGSSISGEKMLLATDGSEYSEQATAEALNMMLHCPLAKKLFVLSVASKDKQLAEAKARAEEVCARAKEMGVKADCIPLSATGRPVEIITATAQENEVDLIFIGGHGRGLSKLLMGHVAEKVIGRANCAVLVVEKKDK